MSGVLFNGIFDDLDQYIKGRENIPNCAGLCYYPPVFVLCISLRIANHLIG